MAVDRVEESYLTKSDSDLHLADMDRAYKDVDDEDRPTLFINAGTDKRRVYWGEGRPNSDDPTAMAIGVRGKIWVLALLLRCRASASSKASRLAQDIARVAETICHEECARLSDLYGGPRKLKAKDFLQDLISAREKRACPHDEAGGLLLDIMMRCSIRELRRIGLSEEHVPEFERLVEAEWRSLATSYRLLEQLLPPVEESNRIAKAERSRKATPGTFRAAATLSLIDENLGLRILAPNSAGKRVLTLESSDYDDPTSGLLNVVQGTRPLTIVEGEPFHGKKSCVRELLLRLGDQQGYMALELPAYHGVGAGRTHPIYLPIRSWSAAKIHYLALAREVLGFLVEYRASMGSGEDRPIRLNPPADMTLEQTIRYITKHCTGLPALFIFTDVDLFDLDHRRKAVRDSGITRLISALARACPDSRIIVTATSFLQTGDDALQSLDLPSYDRHRVDQPALSALLHFLPERHQGKIAPAYGLAATGVRSDDLILIAAFVALSPAGALSEIPIREFLSREKHRRDAVRTKLYTLILDAIEARGLLPALALISASDDGLRDASLLRLLRIWQAAGEPGIPDPDESMAALPDFVDDVGSRFLHRLDMVRFDPDEFDFGEKPLPQDQVWEMDRPIAASFQHALRALRPRIALHSRRLVAQLARRRAQIKKVRMPAPLADRATEDASRDIQAYVTLLAGIKYRPNDLDIGGPLRLCEEEVFTLDETVFSSKRALRFAVQCLLQGDIDRDFRLTMIFDEDALRLELYLLVFLELGIIHNPLLGPLEFPDELPSHLRNGPFSVAEVIDLMTTVALSAFHARRYDIVCKVAAVAERYVREMAGAEYGDLLARIYCCQLDAAILRGEPPVVTYGTPPPMRDGLLGALDYARYLLELPEFDIIDSSASARRSSDMLRRRKGRMRLLAREAELLGLTNYDPWEGLEKYEELQALEAEHGEGRSEKYDPIVLSGRTARRYIRLLLSPLALERDSISAIMAVEALLAVNASRLRRFSGGDRVGVLVDHARINLAADLTLPAIESAQAASDLAFGGNVSPSGRLEALAAFAEANLSHAENLFKTGSLEGIKPFLRAALEKTRETMQRADSLEYASTRGFARVLLARWHLLTAEVAKHERKSESRIPSWLQRAGQYMAEATVILDDAKDLSLHSTLKALDIRLEKISPAV